MYIAIQRNTEEEELRGSCCESTREENIIELEM